MKKSRTHLKFQVPSNEYYLFIILNFHITPILDAPARPKENFTLEFQGVLNA